MRRWDLEYEPGNYVGAGDSVLVPRNGGDWVDYDDHLAELRQTQRRMIAALYWRAGVWRDEGYTSASHFTVNAARVLEAACPR